MSLQGLPRVSGDGPEADDAFAQEAEAAPRERGWTLQWTTAGRNTVGCPA